VGRDSYSPCSAYPNVRICVSNGMPSLSKTVECSDWYMFCLGVEI
jgi:hypothetical protein